MGIDLVLLANSTSLNILSNKGRQAWPPELGGYQLACFQDSRVSGSGVVVMFCHGSAAKFKVIRDIPLIFVGEDTPFVSQISQFGLKWEGHFTIQSL